MSKATTSRSTITVTFENCQQGLGIRITGGRIRDLNEIFGIFIKEIIPGSLSSRHGVLKEGDQLMEANGQSLVGVSHERAFEILKHCTSSNYVKLNIARDNLAHNEYRRLSDILNSAANSPSATETPIAPITSTPFYDGKAKENIKEINLSQDQHMKSEANSMPSPPWGSPLESPNFDSSTAVLQWQKETLEPPVKYPDEKRNSAATANSATRPSSITSTETSSQDEDEGLTKKKSIPSTIEETTVPNSYDGSQVALSDVVLSEKHPTSLPDIEESDGHKTSEPSFPPPLPTTPPPSQDDEVKAQPEGIRPHIDMPPLPVLSPLQLPDSFTQLNTFEETITVPKCNSLGLTLVGGTDRSDGPGVYIAKITKGLDAANDGRLNVGDLILHINRESFENVSFEKVKLILNQIKTKQNMKAYTIHYRRSKPKISSTQQTSGTNKEGTSSFTVPDSPIIQKGPPQDSASAAVFDSSTLVVADERNSKTLEQLEQGDIEVPSAPLLRSKPKKGALGNSGRTSAYDSMRQRMSVNKDARFKLTKLEYALNYVGYPVTSELQATFRNKLDVDAQGKVSFKEFANLCKELFPLESGETIIETKLSYALVQKGENMDMVVPDLSGKTTTLEDLLKEHSMEQMFPIMADASTDPYYDPQLEVSDDSNINEDIKTQFKRQHKPQINDADNSLRAAELLKKLALTEKALKASKKKEKALKEAFERAKSGNQEIEDMDRAELQKRLAVVDAERKKEQAAAQRYQVTTEKLLQFVEECHDILIHSPDASKILYHLQGTGQSTLRGDQVTGNPRPPRYLAKHARDTDVTLAQKARETVAAVHEILQAQVLPYGWEKKYTEKGQVYYVNHQMQTTSWNRPAKVEEAHYITRPQSRHSTSVEIETDP